MKKITIEVTPKQLENLEFFVRFSSQHHPVKGHKETARKLDYFLIKNITDAMEVNE